MNSEMFSLKIRDFLKGVVTAIIGAVLVFVQQSLTSNQPIDYKTISVIALTAGLSYIIKNYFSDTDGKFLGKI